MFYVLYYFMARSYDTLILTPDFLTLHKKHGLTKGDNHVLMNDL